jgi:hypothetical protein
MVDSRQICCSSSCVRLEAGLWLELGLDRFVPLLPISCVGLHELALLDFAVRAAFRFDRL